MNTARMTIYAIALATALPITAQDNADGPAWVNGNELVRPANYRAWPFLGSGLGLNYDAGADAGGPRVFTNVFVNPPAYAAFIATGQWPDESLFVLEFRRAMSETPPNTTGQFQGPLLGLEAEVKDDRFADGWAFFNFGSADALAAASPPLAGAAAAPCVECHTQHTAVERTFVQFYPTLLEIAREQGTLKPGFD